MRTLVSQIEWKRLSWVLGKSKWGISAIVVMGQPLFSFFLQVGKAVLLKEDR